VVLGGLWAATAAAEPLTADRAVQLALQKNTQVIGAEAGVLDARGGLYSSMSGVLPQFRGSISRFNSTTENQTSEGVEFIGGTPFAYSSETDFESHGTTPSVSGSWSVLNLSSWMGLSSARNGLKAARQSRQATRNDVALSARRQFYEVVKAIRLGEVATGALRLARDDERRVRALFEVGSVSRSDLLKAQVRTSQSELDSLNAQQTVLGQRITLASLLGIREAQLGDVDTLLAIQPQDFDEAALVAEAGKARPDLRAVEADLVSARASLTSARLARLPYVTASGQMQLNTQSRSVQTVDGVALPGFKSSTDRNLSGSIAVNMDLFDGFVTSSRTASARARLLRAQDARDALQRNLEAEVHQTLVAHRAAVEQDRVARRGLESATENLKLTQEKYNVGSATILELIDAQVQLQRAQSDEVSALAAIRVAEAQINRVRGRAE
jgi:outer membrane protein TolC